MSEDTETPTPTSTPTPTPTPTSAEYKRTEMLRNLVMGQTGYDAEEAVKKLREHNNDILAIVREYMGAPKEVAESKITTNQAIYKEMRGLMDNAATTHRRKKELEEQKQQYIETMTRLRAAAVQNLRANIDMSGNSTTETDDSSSNTIDVSGN